MYLKHSHSRSPPILIPPNTDFLVICQIKVLPIFLLQHVRALINSQEQAGIANFVEKFYKQIICGGSENKKCI